MNIKPDNRILFCQETLVHFTDVLLLSLYFIEFISIMATYHYVLASRHFLLEEEPLDEVLRERVRDYQEKEKEIDFWLVEQPAFLEAPEMASVKAQCPQPAAAIISTNPTFITWLRLRLEYVLTGQFEAPSDSIPSPVASLSSVS